MLKAKLNNVVLIVAGGSGLRFNHSQPKQYIKINELTIIEQTIKKFEDLVEKIIVAVSPLDTQINKYLSDKILVLKCGGNTRQITTKNALNILDQNYIIDNILIHDACRPFLSKQLIINIISELSNFQGVIPTLEIFDSLKEIQNNYIKHLNRENYRLSQTPQGFKFDKIVAAHNYINTYNFSDDAAIAEAYGILIKEIKGEKTNIKITTNEDIKMQYKYKVGNGLDFHEFCEGDKIWLGGIEVPCDFAIKAHSDGDVILHSLCDAIFGCIGEGDIGLHFPPSDNKWKNAESKVFVLSALEILKKYNGEITNVDITLIAEVPYINSFRERIKNNISLLLNLTPNLVNIKATTTEKLGFIGRKEGIGASTTVTIRIPEQL